MERKARQPSVGLCRNLFGSQSQGRLPAAQAGESTVLTARADGVCGQFKFRLSSSPPRRKRMPVKMGPGSAADIWDAGRALSSAHCWLDRAFLHLFPSKNSSAAGLCGQVLSKVMDSALVHCLGTANAQLISKCVAVWYRRLARPWACVTPSGLPCKEHTSEDNNLSLNSWG